MQNLISEEVLRSIPALDQESRSICQGILSRLSEAQSLLQKLPNESSSVEQMISVAVADFQEDLDWRYHLRNGGCLE